MSTTFAGSRLYDRLVLVALIAVTVVWVAPLIWVIGLSLKPNDVLMRTTQGIFAPPFTFKNYLDIFGNSAEFVRRAA